MVENLDGGEAKKTCQSVFGVCILHVANCKTVMTLAADTA